MSGTWAKAAAECDCHTGVTGAEPRQTGWHWWVPLPRPCCCLGTAELRETIPVDRLSQLGQAAPSGSDPSPSLAALELWSLVAAVVPVSLAWAGCVSLGPGGQRSCWGLVPVRAGSRSLLCTLLGSGFGDSCVSPACPAELSHPVGRGVGWAVFPDRDVLPRTLPMPLLPSQAGGWLLWEPPGAVKAPVTAEPVLPLAACSLPQLLGMQLPALP